MTQTIEIQEDKLCFVDSKENLWDLHINVAKAYEVDKYNFSQITTLQFSFISPNEDFFPEVFSNSKFALALIWCLIQDQIDSDKVPDYLSITHNSTDEEKELREEENQIAFLTLFNGETFRQAKEALLHSLADFFPDQKTVLLMLQRQSQKAINLANLELVSMEEQIESKMKKEIEKASEEVKVELHK